MWLTNRTTVKNRNRKGKLEKTIGVYSPINAAGQSFDCPAAGFFFDALGTRTQDSALWNAAAMSS